MTDDNPMKTWNGKPVGRHPPHGASIIVYREAGHTHEVLALYRAHNGPDYAGDWAWTPSSGARYPGEAIDDCAMRELKEETGLEIPLERTEHGTEDWWMYVGRLEADQRIVLSPEHDRFEWVSIGEAIDRCRPRRVGHGLGAL